jgi:hypothetical protein
MGFPEAGEPECRLRFCPAFEFVPSPASLVECELPITGSEGQKGNLENEREMNVAESSAFHNASSTFSNLHSVIPLGVMGMLLAEAVCMLAPATALLVGFSFMFLAAGMLVPAFFLQPMPFSVFPSLLPVTISPRRAVWRGQAMDAVPERNGTPSERAGL